MEEVCFHEVGESERYELFRIGWTRLQRVLMFGQMDIFLKLGLERMTFSLMFFQRILCACMWVQ